MTEVHVLRVTPAGVEVLLVNRCDPGEGVIQLDELTADGADVGNPYRQLFAEESFLLHRQES